MPADKNKSKILTLIKNQDNVRAVRKALNRKITKNAKTFKIFLNPTTGEIIRGSVDAFKAKFTKSNAQIDYAFKNHTTIKGFIPLSFNTSAGRTNFINNVWTDDNKKIPLNKAPKGTAKMKITKRDFKHKKKVNGQFGISEDTFWFKFDDGEYTFSQAENMIVQMWMKVLKTRKLQPDDLVKVVIGDPSISSNDSHYRSSSLIKVRYFDPLDAINFDEVVESNTEFQLSDETTVDFHTIDMTTGKRGQGLHLKLKEGQFKKRSLIKINNDNDNMCLSRCLVIGDYVNKITRC